MELNNHDVREALCIRVDGLAFPVTWGGELMLAVEAAQCNGYMDAIGDDGELTRGESCCSRLFRLERLVRGAHYVCIDCNEPYTIRAIPVTSDTYVGA